MFNNSKKRLLTLIGTVAVAFVMLLSVPAAIASDTITSSDALSATGSDETLVKDTTYRISEIDLSVVVPEEWVAVTRATPQNSEELVALGFLDYEAYIKHLQTNDIYLYAKNVSSTETDGRELMISAAVPSGNAVDFRGMLSFELAKYAAASFEELNKSGPCTYTYYEVVKGKLPYILLSGTYVDANGNTVYRILCDSYIGEWEIQFDLSAYSALSDSDIAFIKSVINTVVVPPYSGNGKLMATLRYAALAFLAVALIVVIIIFICSQIKTKKAEQAAFDRAIELAKKKEAEEGLEQANTIPENDYAIETEEKENTPNEEETNSPV